MRRACRPRRFTHLLFYGCFILVSLCILHLLETIIGWRRYNYESFFSVYSDNIGAKSVFHDFSSNLPIDAVYTWVNGSDQRFIEALARAKINAQLKRNDAPPGGISERSSSGKGTIYDVIQLADNTTRIKCKLRDCMEAKIVVFESIAQDGSLLPWKDLKLFTPELQQCKVIQRTYPRDGLTNSTVYIAHTQSVETVQRLLEKDFSTYQIKQYQGYLTSATLLQNSLRLENSVILGFILNFTMSNKAIEDSLTSFGRHSLREIYNQIDDHSTVTLTFLDVSGVQDALDNWYSNPALLGPYVNFSPASLVWNIEHLMTESDMACSSRFADNDQLRYSLRSLERYAPWIRKVFIVTNGQIPSWLDTESPRVRIVTHEEIFTNPAHLPTFSSPAIETHIHRIPGLSKRFLYFNDDVFLGAPIHPEDFITHFGFKFHAAYPLPSCSDGCDDSWIGDGYCDLMCNNADCQFDGGDCKKHHFGESSNETHSLEVISRKRLLCAPQCHDMWLGDRYCDQACFTASCGYDVGDCGPFPADMLQFNVTTNGTHLDLPKGTLSFLLNFSSLTHGSQLNSFKYSVPHLYTPVVKEIRASDNQSADASEESYEDKLIRTTLVISESNVIATVIRDSSLASAGSEIVFQLDLTKVVNVSSQGRVEVVFKEYSLVWSVGFQSSQTSMSNSNNTIHFNPPEIRSPKFPPIGQSSSSNITLSEDTSASLLKQNVLDFINLPSAMKWLERELIILLDQALSPPLLRRTLLNILHNQNITLNATALMQLDELLARSVVRKTANQKPAVGVRAVNDSSAALPGAMKASAMLDGLKTIDESGVLRNNQSLSSKQNMMLPLNLSGDVLNPNHGYVTEVRRGGRSLLNTFRDSLRFTGKVFDDRFGVESRYVMAHIPMLVDKDIMEEVQEAFAEEFEATSSSVLRSERDLQFQLTYVSYITSATRPSNLLDIFQQLDVDGSGVLSDAELRILAAQLFPTSAVTHQDMVDFESMLVQCAKDNGYSRPYFLSETYQNPQLPQVTMMFIYNCDSLLSKLSYIYPPEKKFKYHVLHDEPIKHFFMLQTDFNQAMESLDAIRRSRRKFICLNDDFDHNQRLAPKLELALRSFFEGILPHPSQFELPANYRNVFLHVEQHKEWENSRWRIKISLYLIVTVLIVISIGSYFQDKVTSLFTMYQNHHLRQSTLPWYLE